MPLTGRSASAPSPPPARPFTSWCSGSSPEGGEIMFVPGNTQYGVWMRSPSSSGGKDWLGFLTDREVISQWGKTGQVNQSKVIGPAPSRIFLDRKIEEKKGKG